MNDGPGLPPNLPDLPLSEQPVIRIQELPSEYLSDTELLSMFFGPVPPAAALARSRDLLSRYGSLKALAAAGIRELRSCGLSLRTACAVKSALALASRVSRTDISSRPRIQSPAEAAAHMRPVFGAGLQEEFHVLMLDAKNNLLRRERVTVGLVDRSQVHAREVFRSAIRESCSRVILVHNHPTGDPTPSPQDLASTRNLTAAGKVVGIKVLDHIIVGEPSSVCPRGYLSLREENLL